jgi:hypothetical protein
VYTSAFRLVALLAVGCVSVACAAPVDDEGTEHAELGEIVTSASAQAHTSSGASALHTPRVGSRERCAILDAIRTDQKTLTGLDMRFVVTKMNVQGSWGFVEVNPRSPDGRQHYEGLSALLQRKGTEWRVAGYVSSEGDGDFRSALNDLERAFPQAPKALFR